jgi:hypothetical protein
MNKLPYRQIHMDFHTSPFIDNIGAKFKADEFVNVLKKANVNSINLFAKCHHGMYYYPTKIGTMHPGLKFDLLGAQVKACRKEGIRTCIYTCVAWNEDWADRHPEWLQVGFDGLQGCKMPFSSEYYKWRNLCINNREYKSLLKDELEEIYNLYKPDGYWIDIVLQKNCVCRTCQEEMRAMYLEPSNLDDVIKHDRFVEIKFMKEIYEFLKQLDSGLGIYFNGHPYEMDMADDIKYSAKQKRKYNTYIDIESLPSTSWGYTHFPVAVNYLNKYGQELTMMNGKFHMAWGDFGSLRNKEALEYECFRAVANGTKCCIGDQLHPSGLIDKTVYNRIGQVYESIAKKEKWLVDTRKVSQIGVYAGGKVLDYPDTIDINATVEGVYRMLTEMHHMFDYIDFLDDLKIYNLVIIADDVKLTYEAAENLKEYINNGGKVILTGKSGLDPAGKQFIMDEFGLEFISEAEFCPRYIHIEENMLGDIPAMDYVMYERGVAVKVLQGTETIASITNPYFNRTYDRFCSHRQTPPSEVSDEPCITRYKDVIYIAQPLFRDYALNGNKVYKQIIGECISRLLENPLIISDFPTTAEVTLRKQGNNYILHVLNYLIQRKCRNMDIIEEKLPLYDCKVRLRTDSQPVKVYTVPQAIELKYTFDGVYTDFAIPEIDGHQMVMIDMMEE